MIFLETLKEKLNGTNLAGELFNTLIKIKKFLLV